MARIQSLRSSRQRDLHKKRMWKTAIALVVALVSVASTIVLFFDSRFFRISSIRVEGGSPAIDAQIQSIIERSVAGNFLWFIPKDSFFFFPSSALSKSIAAEFPSIASISVSRTGLSSVVATVDNRLPYAIACLGSTNECYYSDDNGVIFETASSTYGAFLVYRISLPTNTNPIGIDFLDSGRLQAVSAFVGGLSRLGFTDDDIAVSPSDDYDLSLEYTKDDISSSSALPSSSSDIYSSATPILHLFMNESRPFPETLIDFSAFWQEYMSKATDTAIDQLSSVDMRYGDNVIYKTR